MHRGTAGMQGPAERKALTWRPPRAPRRPGRAERAHLAPSSSSSAPWPSEERSPGALLKLLGGLPERKALTRPAAGRGGGSSRAESAHPGPLYGLHGGLAERKALTRPVADQGGGSSRAESAHLARRRPGWRVQPSGKGSPGPLSGLHGGLAERKTLTWPALRAPRRPGRAENAHLARRRPGWRVEPIRRRERRRSRPSGTRSPAPPEHPVGRDLRRGARRDPCWKPWTTSVRWRMFPDPLHLLVREPPLPFAISSRNRDRFRALLCRRLP